MPVERINPPGLSKSPAYSQVVKAGNTVYVAGQTAINERGEVVGRGDITAQTTQVFENLKTALAAAGAGFEHLTTITVYVTDPRYREALRDVRARYLGDRLPASTLLVVAALADPDYLVEISAIAVVG
jgi:enamine deaminase RidA (YjgF/YER057c/UK114 family)